MFSMSFPIYDWFWPIGNITYDMPNLKHVFLLWLQIAETWIQLPWILCCYGHQDLVSIFGIVYVFTLTHSSQIRIFWWFWCAWMPVHFPPVGLICVNWFLIITGFLSMIWQSQVGCFKPFFLLVHMILFRILFFCLNSGDSLNVFIAPCYKPGM